MTQPKPYAAQAVIVEEEVHFNLADLCRACRVEQVQVLLLVEEGVLQPAGEAPEDWRFSGASLPRARTALRLAHDLELAPPATALVLDLLDQIHLLKTQLRRAGPG